jgi:hypothetical protein
LEGIKRMTKLMETTPIIRSENELFLGIIRLKVLFKSTKIFPELKLKDLGKFF